MTFYVLGIGSNKNAESQCRQMVAAINAAFGPLIVSELVVTQAVGVNAPDYVNGVIGFESNIDAKRLKQWCKLLEEQLGRDRGQRLCAADIDLLISCESSDLYSQEELIEQINEPWFQPLAAQVLSASLSE